MNVVFDFGGVVFNWSPADLLKRELPAHTQTPAEAKALIETVFEGYGGDWGAFDRGLVEPDELAERIAARSHLSIDEVMQIINGVPRELQPVPDTVALLHELHAAGHRLHYLSNMPAPFADHLERTNDFFRLFVSGVFSGRVKLAKPDLAIFRVAQEHFKLQPRECIFFDDHAPNIEAAEQEGWTARLFTTPGAARDDLVALGALSPR